MTVDIGTCGRRSGTQNCERRPRRQLATLDGTGDTSTMDQGSVNMGGIEPIVADELIAEAHVATGLTDFGDPPILPALYKIVDALNDEARLSPFGREARAQSLRGVLVNRLLLEGLLQAQPGILDDEIGTPVVIVGLPRSGTTKLQRMIASDPRLNSIKMWECLFPMPLSARPDDRNTRVGLAEDFCDSFRALPEFYAAHPVMADEPDEEMVLMRHSLLNESLDAEVKVPSFIHWLRGQDRTPMYQQLAVWLRVLAREHGKVGGPWILKGTYHGAHLDVLLDQLPQAKIVYCHRDPVQTIASYCSLVSKMRCLCSDDVDNFDVGQELLTFWSAHLAQTMEVRGRLPEGHVLDVAYSEIVRDGVGVAERIYDFADLDFNPAAREAISAWEQDNAQHKHGRHAYTVTDYGLTDDMIANECDQYRKQYADFIERV